MKMAVSLASPMMAGAHPEPSVLDLDLRARVAAYATLTKPRIALMVLITVAVGFLLGANGRVMPLRLVLTLVGTGMVAGGASAWNMILERDRDARMRRTANRPIPSGRITLGGAVAFAPPIPLGQLRTPMVIFPVPCGPFVGMTQAQVATALGQAQAALIALETGGKAVSVSYAQGNGSKAVSFSAADASRLRVLIRQLSEALGIGPRRRAIGFRFR